MADPKSKAPAPGGNKGKTVPGIRVASAVDGFRRGGRAWSTTPVDVPLSALTGAQLKQLREEPRLVVVDIEVDVPDAPAAETKGE